MTLSSGASLSHFKLVDQIGEGGMGVVWRATDSTLGRDVALKVLPAAFTGDPERLARFEREARLLASLNHPNIAGIHGLHEADGERFLTMELVDGENLAERLERGAIPVDEAIRITSQIADALESAHEKGIIHRDLKPANVQLAADGTVKVLDFGLAKALEGDGDPVSSPTLTQSPTITAAMTSANVILGTAAYMSPEQARGQRADKRSDIWAMGVVLYEMLTGERLFRGDTVSDTLAAVLRKEPDWNAVPGDTPPRVVAMLKRCIERQAKLRLRDVGEARILLSEVIAGDPGEATVAVKASGPSPALIGGLLAVAAVIGGGLGFLLGQSGGDAPGEVPLRRFLLAGVANEGSPGHPCISPDGTMTAYAQDDEIRVQAFDQMEPEVLAKHVGIADVFWSPDSRFVGFVAGTQVLKVPVNGGGKQIVSDLGKPFTGGSGGTWLPDGRIIASRAEDDGLLAISSLGGDPVEYLAITAGQEGDFHEPHALPEGRGVLFIVHTNAGVSRIDVVSAGGQRSMLINLPDQSLSDVCYAPSGHVLFRRSPTNPGIWALPFSLSSLEVTGEPFLVAPAGASASVSDEGTLTYMSGAANTPWQLVWADRNGKIEPIGEPDTDMGPICSIAPDGQRIAMVRSEGGNTDVWIMDASRGTSTRLTFDDHEENWPRWTPDGESIVYHVNLTAGGGGAGFRILRRRADGTGIADTLATGWAPSVSPDGKQVLFSQGNGMAETDIGTVAIDGGATATPFKEETAQLSPEVSPAGNYVAYTSFESGGQQQIYLKRYPSWEGKWQVSIDGGNWPRWNDDGTRLYYLNDDDFFEVEVSGAASPTLSRPKKLFTRETAGRMFPGAGVMFDVTGDGQRFIWRSSVEDNAVSQSITVVQNWYAEFQDRK